MNAIHTAVNQEPRLSTCWNSTMVLTILVVVGEWISIKGASEVVSASWLGQQRLAHLVFAVGVMVLLLILKKTKRWTLNISAVLFVLLMVPFGLFTWQFHHLMAQSDVPWTPLPGFRLYFLVLGILLSGSYWVNFALMTGFAIECLYLWSALDLGHLPNVILAQEPWVTFMYFGVASILLLFRYRDEKLIQKLSEASANAEAMKQMARIFLSLRDRANTPIQTLKISAELLKRRYPEAQDLSHTIEATAKRLTDINRYLADVESAIPWGNKELITDDEVFLWIQKNMPRS